MAKVTLQLANVDAVNVEISIQATVSEPKDYSEHMRPSHALGHRLSEAISEALMQLRRTVEREIVADA